MNIDSFTGLLSARADTPGTRLGADEFACSVVRAESGSKRRFFRAPGGIRRRFNGPRANGCAAWIGLACSLQFGIGPAEETLNSVRCSCLRVEGLEEATTSAEAVFIGVARSSVEMPYPAAEQVVPQRRVEFEVLGTWKGQTAAVVRVRTGLTDADCGFPFETGAAYLVFALGEPGDLSVTLCSRTALIGDALHDLVELGPPANVAGRP